MIWVFVGFLALVSAAPWDETNYPNPTSQTGAKKCGLRSTGLLCDPDGILNEQSRYRVNHELSRLESRTHQEFGRNFCEKKGINAVIGLAKNVKGGEESDVRRMATELRQRWSLDEQCSKSIVIIVSVGDRKFWVSRDSKVPVYAGEFSQILNAQTSLFQQQNYQQALLNIIQQTTEAALSKQGSLPAPQPPPSSPGGGGKSKGPIGSGGGLPKIPHIPLWVIVAIVLVVIPTLICCCICYCCCCRSKDGGVRRQGPSDDPESGGNRGGGGMGERLRGFLSGAGGALAMNAIQNCFRNRGQRSAAGDGGGAYGGGDGRGGYVPPRPEAEEGKGLYPSKEVKDEGAGGGCQ